MVSRTVHGSRPVSCAVDGDGGSARPAWRERLRLLPGWQCCYRALVFLAGLLLVVVAAALWVFSVVLSVPAALAGLWIWSTEFGWGQRLFRAVRARARRLRSRVGARPARWSGGTLFGVGGGAAAWWAAAHLHLLDRIRTAVGL